MKATLALVAVLGWAEAGWAQGDSLRKPAMEREPMPHASARAAYTIQAPDPEATAEEWIARAEQAGGYFTEHNAASLTLRLPKPQLKPFLDSLEKHEKVVERSYSMQDLSQETLHHTAQLEAKRALLEDYMAILDSTDAASVFTVRQAIVQLQQEIESAQGALGQVQDRTDFARMQIHFRFPDRKAPLPDGSSPFGWIGRLGLLPLKQEFQNGLD